MVQTVRRLPSFLACACTHTHTHTHTEDRLPAHHTPPAAWLLVQMPQMPPHGLPPKAVRRHPQDSPASETASYIFFMAGHVFLAGWGFFSLLLLFQ